MRRQPIGNGTVEPKQPLLSPRSTFVHAGESFQQRRHVRLQGRNRLRRLFANLVQLCLEGPDPLLAGAENLGCAVNSVSVPLQSSGGRDGSIA
jgi:hypothetical protein